ncbi:MAG: S9 family peptidase, partial [Mycobacterium leprae]
YKLDGAGILDPEKHSHVFMINVHEERPEPRQVTRGAWNHRTPVWSPEGGALLFVANRQPDGDYTPFREDLWLQDLAEPETEPRRLTPGTYSVSTPAFSPDGQRIAFRGYDETPYKGYSAERLWMVNRDGSGLTRVDRDWDRTFDSAVIYDMPAPGGDQLVWTSDGTALVTLVSDSGRQQVVAVDAENGNVIALTGGDHCITSWSLDRSGQKLVVSITRPDLPGDLFLVESADLTRLTNVNESLLAELDLAAVETFRFATAEGSNPFVAASGLHDLTETDGWVMKPVGFSPERRYPAILEVHGGPMGMYGWTFFMEFQCLAAAGYVVIYTNPRGSQGYAERFCACIQADWGNLDYLDVMAGLDAALARFPWIDGDRVGIAGGSYGGFMTNWAVGHTDRFKAAVTMRSVVNEASSVGTSDLGFADMMTYPTTPWTDMSFYRRVSPLTFVEQIRTPLLIEHQEEDRRCPIEQAEQLYTALKMLRREVEFVRYPESSHGMSRTGKPWLRVHRLQTIVDWFDRYIAHE